MKTKKLNKTYRTAEPLQSWVIIPLCDLDGAIYVKDSPFVSIRSTQPIGSGPRFRVRSSLDDGRVNSSTTGTLLVNVCDRGRIFRGSSQYVRRVL